VVIIFFSGSLSLRPFLLFLLLACSESGKANLEFGTGAASVVGDLPKFSREKSAK
jgi:hypothetical protein